MIENGAETGKVWEEKEESTSESQKDQLYLPKKLPGMGAPGVLESHLGGEASLP